MGMSGVSHGGGHRAHGAQDPQASQRREEMRKFRSALDGDNSDEAKALKEALGSIKRGQRPSEEQQKKIQDLMAAWQKTPGGAGVTLPSPPPARGNQGMPGQQPPAPPDGQDQGDYRPRGPVGSKVDAYS